MDKMEGEIAKANETPCNGDPNDEHKGGSERIRLMSSKCSYCCGDHCIDVGTPSYDAIVVGSGYGGAVAACRLAHAGLHVCILEKGREWKPHDFPRTVTQLLLKTAFHTSRITLGIRPSTALYQVHMQGDALAVVASGLGGGSLINAGVLLPTPRRARKDPRWPIQWEKDWQTNERKARAMLEPQIVPFDFPNSKVMDAISDEIEDCVKDPVHLNVRMKTSVNSFGVPQNACKACGNCFTGCPYDAKNSTDKNYIAAALKAGACVRTECEVQFVLKNSQQDELDTYAANNYAQDQRKKGRRWRVYINEVDFLLADFVVLSGGVLGTTGILLRSKERGLELSPKLGCSFSTNGNNVAYVAGSRAPTKAYGLTEDKFATIPIPLRPGPSISSSFTSSLGFTIQGAVLPLAFPNLLFKGVFTYQWQGCGCGFLTGVWDKVKHWVKAKDSEALVLNMMGVDSADGRIELDADTGRLKIFPPHDPMLTKKILTFQKLTKRLGGTLFMSRHRSSSVHLLGACPASYDAQHGVVNPSGQVFDTQPHRHEPPYPHIIKDPASLLVNRNPSSTDLKLAIAPSMPMPFQVQYPSINSTSSLSSTHVHAGLYACDASIIPCAIGINPSLTITILAEHISNHLVNDALQYLKQGDQTSPANIPSRRILNYDRSHPDYNSFDLDNNRVFGEQNINKMAMVGTDQLISKNGSHDVQSSPKYCINGAGAIVRETLHGDLDGMPCTLHLVMHMGRAHHKESSKGKFEFESPINPLLRGRVGGRLVMKALDPYVMYIVDGEVDMCSVDPRTPYTQYMHYHLDLASASGARYILKGLKEMRPFLAGFSLWRESTTLHVCVQQTALAYSQASTHTTTSSAPMHGTMHVSLSGLCRSLWTMKGPKRVDFVKGLAESFVRTYILSRPWLLAETIRRMEPKALKQIKYPTHVIHNITTDDGFEISCVQWSADQMRSGYGMLSVGKPVLLLNGYSTESFWLPTERHDLVRALLEQGHEVWLLRPRLHPEHTTTRSFNLDDVARFDVPAAFMKLREILGDMEAVHVVAHCVGGLAIHMAILGGFLPATSVASLTCTNSAMFFRVSTLARIKLWLPLIPISMAIMGGNPVLQLIAKAGVAKDGWRHKLLKRIAKAIPRTERCTCDECEVFSGVFGNTFWHDNVRLEVHQWLNKENVHRLPMQAFTHLRTICNAGAIVGADGSNKYLPHAERLAVPTTYISGGRLLLVVPSTTERALAFMQLHHPHLAHRREVIHGYGHSDLLVGEFSHRDVFPHILHSIAYSDKQPPSPNPTHHNHTTITSNNHTLRSTSIFHSSITFPISILSIFVLCILLLFLFSYFQAYTLELLS